jgi:hypothetical protein
LAATARVVKLHDKSSTKRAIGECMGDQRAGPPPENLLIDPGEDDRLEQHREEAERNDDIATIDSKRLIIMFEKDQMPDEAECEGRYDISENS